ncbi:hypothetical protein EYC80_006206 [Monilinia laxa]|uniref:Uncharacterized protein n=1 Tax=Monilinia laxa TaxID=61186 RepID=A0A5N6KH23_MONLA|nr:hypothetical protein EYC80_006206 [Monilinia laxa]
MNAIVTTCNFTLNISSPLITTSSNGSLIWNVSFRHLLDKFRVRIVEHNVEVLYGMNRLQTPPIPKPDDL